MFREELQNIVDRLVEKVEPERIYLFGSHAKGTATKNSDLDLLIIADIDGSTLHRKNQIYDALQKTNFRVDAHVQTPSEFDRWKHLINHIGGIVFKEGKILYNREGFELSQKGFSMAEHLNWVQRWFNKGDNDLRAAEALQNIVDPPLLDVIYFHCQQCVEKYLKGFLTFHHKEVERTHNLGKLVDECTKIDEWFAQWRPFGKSLSYGAVDARYPGDYDYTPEQVDEAIAIANKIKKFILEKLPSTEN